MSRSASYTLAADLPPWAPLLLLAATFVLETWSGATASAWGPDRCECAQAEEP